MDVDLPQLFENALAQFAHDERDLVRSGVSERSLCGRFAMILEPMAHQLGLTDYRADIEYNRNGADVIKGYIRHEYHDLVQITCDVILHARGRRFPDNLIAIEMKRDIHPPQYKESDRQRLIALTTAEQKFFDDQGAEIPHVSGYHVGYFLEIQDRERYAIEEYIAGALSRSWVFALER